MFTFSFSSAFAKTDFETSTTGEAMQVSDYIYSGSTTGTVGVTDNERDSYVSDLEDAIEDLEWDNEVNLSKFYATYTDVTFNGDDYTMVDEALKSALEAAKVAKTSRELSRIDNALVSTILSATLTSSKVATPTNDTITLTKDDATYVLPGYGFYTGKTVERVVSTGSGNNGLVSWLLDNDFEADIYKSTLSSVAQTALEAALVKVDTATNKKVYDDPGDNTTPAAVAAYYEFGGLVSAFNATSITELDAVVDAYKALSAFQTKYGTAIDATEYNGATYNADKVTAKVSAAFSYYENVAFAAEEEAIAKLKSTEILANKDKIVALADAIKAYNAKYYHMRSYSNASLLSKLQTIENLLHHY